ATARRSQAAVIHVLRELQDAGQVAGFRSHFISNVISVSATEAAVNRLGSLPEVTSIEPARDYPLAVAPTATTKAGRAPEWNITRIGAPAAWAAGAIGTGVVLATLDTGARFTHQSMVGQYRGNQGGGVFDHDFSWYDATGLCPGPEPCDDNGYGTSMVSLMVGDDGGANQIGAAPGARWITARGCEGASCSNTSLLAGAEWLLAPCPVGVDPGHRDCDPDFRPDVIAIGWGGGGGDPWYMDAVDAWRAAGIVPVVMAGSGGPTAGSISTPAWYCTTIAVGGVDDTDTVLTYSARGPGAAECPMKPELVAPGGSIRVATNVSDSSYGTSFGGTGGPAAEVAGCAALVLSEAPWLPFVDLQSALLESADDLPPTGFDYDSGWGVARCDLAIATLADMLLVDDFERGSTTRWSGAEPPVTDQLFLFDGGGVSVAIGGRAGADAMCATAVVGYPGLPASHVKALITVDADDEIRDMPALYGVPTDRQIVGPTGLAVAADWADLLDGSIERPLAEAQVLDSANYWYSGSTAFGTLAPTTCSGWTNNGALFDGRYGGAFVPDDGWISRSDATCGLATYHVLCLAWDD
ncbi:MAG: S8 family serine peptidase, partial [Holophagae bacterium]